MTFEVRNTKTGIRRSGIGVLGDVPWGTHFCQFYHTKDDLLDILVPYFKAGLESNELCMWITSDPLSPEEALQALGRAVPNLRQHLDAGQLLVLPHTEWYLKDGSFELQRVLDGWVNKLNAALERGYDGLRLTGNTAWLRSSDWRDFTEYEKAISTVLGGCRMIALCTYAVDKCGASQVIDVVKNHEFALIRRGGEWELIETSERKQAEERLRFLGEAGAVLASSLDYEATLANVASMAVPAVADWCVVDMVADDGSIEALAVVHVDAEKVQWARELRCLYLVDPSSAVGPPAVIRTGQSEFYPDVSDSMLIALTKGDEAALEILRKVGCRSAMVVPLRGRDRVLGAISLVSAESGRRFSEADLVLAEALANRAALALDNARLYRQAQEAIRLRDQFLSSISHDLRNPLTSIKGVAQVLMRLLKQSESPNPQALLQGLQSIESNATRMNVLISDLLDVARLQMGQTLHLHRAPTDLVALARQIARDHQQLTARHQILVEADVAELVGHWDAPRLERVISNLLSNAVKFSPDGGTITVTVCCEGQGDACRAILSVQDQGIGIPAEDLPTVFDLFTRARNAERVGGTGIGLASVHQIVEQHGGTITATSEVGKGSTFVISLPLAGSAPDR